MQSHLSKFKISVLLQIVSCFLFVKYVQIMFVVCSMNFKIFLTYCLIYTVLDFLGFELEFQVFKAFFPLQLRNELCSFNLALIVI